jgi:hypothetical protein
MIDRAKSYDAAGFVEQLSNNLKDARGLFRRMADIAGVLGALEESPPAPHGRSAENAPLPRRYTSKNRRRAILTIVLPNGGHDVGKFLEPSALAMQLEEATRLRSLALGCTAISAPSFANSVSVFAPTSFKRRRCVRPIPARILPQTPKGTCCAGRLCLLVSGAPVPRSPCSHNRGPHHELGTTK